MEGSRNSCLGLVGFGPARTDLMLVHRGYHVRTLFIPARAVGSDLVERLLRHIAGVVSKSLLGQEAFNQAQFRECGAKPQSEAVLANSGVA